MLDPVELMFALKKLRARRAPANQAHVTNLKENPALLAADAAEAAARGFAEVETTVGVSRYAPLNAIAILVGVADRAARRDDAVRRRGAPEPAARDPGARHVRRDALGLRDGAGVRRRRRHAVVEGVPRLRVRLARGQGALHLGRRLRGADGRVGGQVDALPRGALPLAASAPRARRACRTARSRASRSRSSVPGGTREVLAENVLAAWLDLEVASGNDAIASHSEIRKTAKLMGQFLPGHRLRHVGLLVDAALRQHVRRRQLRLARLRRVADDPARLAGRRRDRAARRGGRARGARARRARRAGRVRRARLPGDHATTRCGSPRRASTRATCRIATARPTSLAGDRVLDEGISGLDVARALDAARLRRRRRRRSSTCSVSASRRTTSRRRRSSSPTAGVVSAVNEPNDYRGPGTGYRLEGGTLGAAAPAAARDRRAAARRRAGCAEPSSPSRAGAAARRAGRGRRRGRAGVRGRAGETINGLGARRRARGASSTVSREAGGSPRSCVFAARPTSRSSATTARASRAPASRWGCSRRERR